MDAAQNIRINYEVEVKECASKFKEFQDYEFQEIEK
jgi:hypothetical protein